MKLWMSALLLSLTLVACSGKKAPTQADFVGKWQSSKLATPLYLYSNGEWEIKKDDGGVLQYGVWEYKNGFLVWHVKIGHRIQQDTNAVLSFTAQEFRLQESDEISTFTRLE